MLYSCDPSICLSPSLYLVVFIILCVLFGIAPVLFSYYTNKILQRTGNPIRSLSLAD
ncbi:hypothetical protein OG21DRAFT_1505549 [Imleria badia]|nr:hypothetical protein OG21DRAFT_1505549 [Imleria badia]